MKNRSSAFTLVELLVSVTILAGLMLTGSYTYQMLANRWDKDLGEFKKLAQEARAFSLTRNLLSGVLPFVVLDQKPSSSKPAFFFIGDKHKVLSISHSGLYSKDYPEVFRLTSVAKENGLYDLVYQSVSTERLLLLFAEQEVNFKRSVVLFKDLEEIEFRYLGWDGFVQKSDSSETGEVATWRSTFSGIDNQLLPVSMSVYLKGEEKEISFMIDFDQKSLRYLTPYLDQASG